MSKHANGRDQFDDIAVVCFGRLESENGPKTGTVRAAAPRTLRAARRGRVDIRLRVGLGFRSLIRRSIEE